MKEEFLHYIWKFQLFNENELTLVDGSQLQIIHPGIQNFDAGPDFFNAQIRINDTKWAGNIELHLNTSDWIKHNHQIDKSYDNVILHVVWKNDKTIKRLDDHPIPTLELYGLVKRQLLENYNVLINNSDWIPCAKSIHQVEDHVILSFKDRMLVERLEEKSERVNKLLIQFNNDWEEVLYQILVSNFGFKVNSLPMELLARSSPFNLLRKYQNDIQRLEALLFGQAGFLEGEFKGNYAIQLKEEYNFLRNKFKLLPMESSIWKFSRMRPPNFPTIRIAQIAALYAKHRNLFQRIKDAESLNELTEIFQIQNSEYWNSHYRFDVPALKKTDKNLGIRSINIILINTVVPLLFCYGKKLKEEKFVENAIGLLEKIPAENNQIIKKWKSLNLNVKFAFDSQALIQLKNKHCDLKKCLNCMIGNSIIKQT